MYIQQIQNQISSAKDSAIKDIDIMQLPFVKSVMQADLSYLQDADYLDWKKKFEKYIVFGIGGSSLGGQAIKQALAPHATVDFYDNIDPHTMQAVLSNLKNLKNNFQSQNIGFLIISKSGETIETLSQLLLVLNLGYSSQHFIVITENKPSTLTNLCRDYKIKIIPHAQIGGRYSVLSPTGLIPADLMGLNIEQMLSGAQNEIRQFTPNNFQIAAAKHKISNEVFFIYSDRLNKFGEWIRQLLAESSGKNNKGITPILAQGATDQHSQLQLYLGGPADKLYTFIIEHNTNEIPMPSTCEKYLPFLQNKTLNELFLAEAKATRQTICLQKYPVRTFDIYNLNEKTLGHLFMYFMLETVLTCTTLDINPFDQPHVETGKRLIREMV